MHLGLRVLHTQMRSLDQVLSQHGPTDSRSPFIVGKMITDPLDFFGRTREVNDILGRLRKMESTSIVGPRRIGKSSIAYYTMVQGPSELGEEYEFVWLDGQSNHCKSVDGFCAAVANGSSLAYRNRDTSSACLISFEDSVRCHHKKLILIINEFELLTDVSRHQDFNVDFYNTLRLLAEQGHCAIVTTSYASLKQLCQHVLGVSSPFYNIFSEINLENFTDAEVDGFLNIDHRGVVLDSAEQQFIKARVNSHKHPLVLQIACDAVFKNRHRGTSDKVVLKEIHERSKYYFSHDSVQEDRKMARQRSERGAPAQISKPVDLAISILIPVLGLGLLMAEYGLLIRTLSNFQSVLLALVTALLGFAVLIFAGRSIDIIGESTFFRIFLQLVNQIPLLSSLANNLISVADTFRK